MRLFTHGVLILGTIAYIFVAGGAGQEDARSCRYRRTQGVCKRRTECRRPTTRICSFGFNPIVCCLDKPKEETPSPPVVSPPETTQSRPKPPVRPTTPAKPPVVQTETRPQPKPPAVPLTIDLTFPGCGSRSPSAPQSRSQDADNNNDKRTARRRGIFRGKRDTSGGNYRQRRQLRPVIVGGVISAKNSWPWMAAIFKRSTPAANSRFLCGASLISTQYVLSAAHCFDAENEKIDSSKFTINLGAHDTRGGTEYPVESIKVHPGYKARQYYNDLSILKLSRKVPLSEKVYPVCMPAQPHLRNRVVTEHNVTVTGWGDTTFGGVQSKVLREVSIPVVPIRECNNSYATVARSTFSKGITDSFICAGVKEGGKDACQGDSGGPMVMEVEKNKWEQLGVVSFGYGCAQAGYPGVYTRVAKYNKWIYENTDLGRK